jgi:lysosomal acid lipase/cholesteryl ester hydrolase
MENEPKRASDSERRLQSDLPPKKVVMLQHGFENNLESWITDSSPGQILPFYIADQGYDVWLAPTRGSPEYTSHKLFDPEKDYINYWDYDER